MKKIIITISALSGNLICFAQDENKIIPDKVFEMGIPLLFIFLVLNTIVAFLKNRAEQQLKLKMIEKGVSEEALIKIFKESNAIAKLQPLKWFLFSLALGLSLILIYFTQNYFVNSSGYAAIGIILLFSSLASFIYYRILSRKI